MDSGPSSEKAQVPIRRKFTSSRLTLALKIKQSGIFAVFEAFPNLVPYGGAIKV